MSRGFWYYAGRGSGPVWPGGREPMGLFRDLCYIPGDLLNNGVHRVDLTISQDEKLIWLSSGWALLPNPGFCGQPRLLVWEIVYGNPADAGME